MPTIYLTTHYKHDDTLLISGWHSVLVDQINDNVLNRYALRERVPTKILDKYLLIAGLSDEFIPLAYTYAVSSFVTLLAATG